MTFQARFGALAGSCCGRPWSQVGAAQERRKAAALGAEEATVLLAWHMAHNHCLLRAGHAQRLYTILVIYLSFPTWNIN